MRVLVVEDEPGLRSYLVPLLERAGYTADAVATGAEALASVADRRPDLVLLDVGLPDLSGLEVCRHLRTLPGYLPVIMLTGLDAREDELRGFEVKADDYITKPVVPDTLLARIRAVLRLAAIAEAGDTLTLGSVQVDLRAREARRNGTPLALGPKEFDLLAFLLEHPGQVFGKTQLLAHVWGPDFDGDPHTVESQDEQTAPGRGGQPQHAPSTCTAAAASATTSPSSRAHEQRLQRGRVRRATASATTRARSGTSRNCPRRRTAAGVDPAPRGDLAMTSRLILAVTWLLLALPPLWWWLRNARRLDPWTVLPIPAALLGPGRNDHGPDGPYASRHVHAPDRDCRPPDRSPGPAPPTGPRWLSPGSRVGARWPSSCRPTRSGSAATRSSPSSEPGWRTTSTPPWPRWSDTWTSSPTNPSATRPTPRSGPANASSPACRPPHRTCSRSPDCAPEEERAAANSPAPWSRRRPRRCSTPPTNSRPVLTVQVPTERVLVDVAEADLVRALRNLILNSLRHGLGTERTVLVSVDRYPRHGHLRGRRQWPRTQPRAASGTVPAPRPRTHRRSRQRPRPGDRHRSPHRPRHPPEHQPRRPGPSATDLHPPPPGMTKTRAGRHATRLPRLIAGSWTASVLTGAALLALGAHPARPEPDALSPYSLAAYLRRLAGPAATDIRINGVYGSGHHGAWQFVAALTWRTPEGTITGGTTSLPQLAGAPTLTQHLRHRPPQPGADRSAGP